MNFEDALKHTLRFEGGYADDPDDSGGETFRGISRRNWPDWAGWAAIDAAKGRGAAGARLIDTAFKDDPQMAAAVADFYRRRFWRPFESLGAPGRVRAKLFDTAVNVGVGGAVRFVQRALNSLGAAPALLDDGAPGPKTRAAFKSLAGDQDAFLLLICREQEAHYRRLARRKPSQNKFLKGWLRRAEWLPR